MRFGTLLGKLRQNADFSQKRLAATLNWDQSYLSKIESGKKKPPSREVLLSIAGAMNLSEEDTDQLLLAAEYQPQSILEMGIDDEDFSLKKHISALKEIREKIPLSSYIRAKEEIADYLDLIRMKYLQKPNESIVKNTLLADYIYSKVKRGGLKALYAVINQPQGGAILVQKGKVLLAQIGISPLRGVWHVPAGFVNPKKGDHNAKDIAVRLVKQCIDNAQVEIVKELTAHGEALENIDTTEDSIKLGYFPAVFQGYEVRIKDKKIKLVAGAKFVAFEDIPKLKEGIHPLLSQIIRPFIKDKKLINSIYLKGEETIQKIIQKWSYKQDLDIFYKERIKKTIK